MPLPGRTVLLDARAVCPAVEGVRDVVALVELLDRTGDDGLVAARTRVVAAR